MDFLLIVGLMVGITVIPVMVAAKLIGAENSGFWTCFFAVILSSITGSLCETLISNELLAGMSVFVITAIAFSVVLGASFLQSVVISLVAVALQLATALLFLGSISH